MCPSLRGQGGWRFSFQQGPPILSHSSMLAGTPSPTALPYSPYHLPGSQPTPFPQPSCSPQSWVLPTSGHCRGPPGASSSPPAPLPVPNPLGLRSRSKTLLLPDTPCPSFCHSSGVSQDEFVKKKRGGESEGAIPMGTLVPVSQ